MIVTLYIADKKDSPCEICGKLFKSRSHVRDHIKTQHLNKYAYYCPKCGHGVQKKKYLDTHVCGRVRRRQNGEEVVEEVPTNDDSFMVHNSVEDVKVKRDAQDLVTVTVIQDGGKEDTPAKRASVMTVDVDGSVQQEVIDCGTGNVILSVPAGTRLVEEGLLALAQGVTSQGFAVSRGVVAAGGSAVSRGVVAAGGSAAQAVDQFRPVMGQTGGHAVERMGSEEGLGKVLHGAVGYPQEVVTVAMDVDSQQWQPAEFAPAQSQVTHPVWVFSEQQPQLQEQQQPQLQEQQQQQLQQQQQQQQRQQKQQQQRQQQQQQPRLQEQPQVSEQQQPQLQEQPQQQQPQIYEQQAQHTQFITSASSSR